MATQKYDELLMDPTEADVEAPDYLKESLRIVRGQTMMLARKQHLEAVIQNRDEILVTLKQALCLLDTFVKEVEIITGRLGSTRAAVADIQKRYDVEVAQ